MIVRYALKRIMSSIASYDPKETLDVGRKTYDATGRSEFRETSNV
jgi:hypothetical protein